MATEESKDSESFSKAEKLADMFCTLGNAADSIASAGGVLAEIGGTIGGLAECLDCMPVGPVLNVLACLAVAIEEVSENKENCQLMVQQAMLILPTLVKIAKKYNAKPESDDYSRLVDALDTLQTFYQEMLDLVENYMKKNALRKWLSTSSFREDAEKLSEKIRGQMEALSFCLDSDAQEDLEKRLDFIETMELSIDSKLDEIMGNLAESHATAAATRRELSKFHLEFQKSQEVALRAHLKSSIMAEARENFRKLNMDDPVRVRIKAPGYAFNKRDEPPFKGLHLTVDFVIEGHPAGGMSVRGTKLPTLEEGQDRFIFDREFAERDPDTGKRVLTKGARGASTASCKKYPSITALISDIHELNAARHEYASDA